MYDVINALLDKNFKNCPVAMTKKTGKSLFAV